MININSGATNSVVLRLDSISPIYLFKLTSVQSNETFFFTADNISPSTKFFECRIYEVSGTTQSVALTASMPLIQLSYGGSYNYTLYGTDNYDLEPTNDILDTGKLTFNKPRVGLSAFDLDDNEVYGAFDED